MYYCYIRNVGHAHMCAHIYNVGKFGAKHNLTFENVVGCAQNFLHAASLTRDIFNFLIDICNRKLKFKKNKRISPECI